MLALHPLVLLPLFSAFLISAAAAQEANLSLEDLLGAALQKNAAIQNQRGEQHIAALQQRQALGKLLPQADAEAGYLKTSGPHGVPDLAGANGTNERIAWLSVQQTVFDAEIMTGISAARLAREKQDVLYDQQKQELLLQVIEAYFLALQARGEVEVFSANLDAFELMYEQSQELFANGVAPELDVRKSRVEYLFQQRDLAAARVEYQDALNAVKELVGMAVEDSLSLRDFPGQTIHLDSLSVYLRAAEERPERQVARIESGEARQERQLARLGRLPSVEVGAYYGWDAEEALGGDNLGWQVYAGLRLPLWHWQRQRQEGRIAAIHYQQSQARDWQLQQQIAREVRDAFAGCQVQQQQVAAMQESAAEAEIALQMARTGYQEGTVISLELIATQKLLTQARSEHLQAEYALYIAKARLYRSIGRLEEKLTWLE